jgi:hypothetical protein
MTTAITLIAILLVIIFLAIYTEKRERKRLKPYMGAFSRFVQESRLTCPRNKGYPDATLFRHVWRRAVVLQVHLAETDEEKQLLEKIQEIAARNYYACAPKNVYGEVRLAISPNQILQYLKREQSKPGQNRIWDTKRLPCIYLGMTKDQKTYIGKTEKEPETRWVQHRRMATGPFKNGADYAEWKIIRGNLLAKELDFWESYYIGYFNSYEDGYNENPGNDLNAYEQGKKKREDKVVIGKDDV